MSTNTQFRGIADAISDAYESHFGFATVTTFVCNHFSNASPCLETFDFVENLLVDGGLSVVYSQSNTGKTFYVLDLAAHVADGRTYRDDMEVDQGAVLYLTLEGGMLFRNRLSALRQAGHVSPSAQLFYATVGFDVMSATDPHTLIATVAALEQQHGTKFRLVVIDTLARAMPNGDENQTSDMNRVVINCDKVREETKAHVMLVHHTGKDGTKGARGAVALKCAVDTEIELSLGEEKIIVATVTKQKDLPYIDPMGFSLKVVELGINTRKKPVTSCVVEHHPELAVSPKKGGAFTKSKPPPKPEDVLSLAPSHGTVKRTLFVAESMEQLTASRRDVDAVVDRLIADGKLHRGKIKVESGQWESHLSRTEF